MQYALEGIVLNVLHLIFITNHSAINNLELWVKKAVLGVGWEISDLFKNSGSREHWIHITGLQDL